MRLLTDSRNYQQSHLVHHHTREDRGHCWWMPLFEQQTQPQYIHSTIKMTEYLKLCLGKLICVGARRPAAASTREPLGCKICVMLVWAVVLQKVPSEGS